MNKFLKEMAYYFVFIFVFVIVAINLQAAINSNFKNDNLRHSIINEALKKRDAKIIVLGNSLSMFGVDAKIIRKKTKDNAHTYNLSSVGQIIDEGAYYISQINDSVKHIFHCIEFEDLLVGAPVRLSDGKALSMIMNGYHIDDDTKSIIANINSKFLQNRYLSSFQARTYIRSILHNYFRLLFDNEKLNDNFLDLYYPFIYTREKHINYSSYLGLYKKRDRELKSVKFLDYKIDLIHNISKYLENKNISYTVVVMPVNRDRRTMNFALLEEFEKKLQSESRDIKVLSLLNILKVDEFYDAIHSNVKGAKVISKHLADYYNVEILK